MGSGPSTANSNEANTRNSVDSNGKKNQPKVKGQASKKKKKRRNNQPKVTDQSRATTMAEADQHMASSAAAGLAPFVVLDEISSGMPQLVVLNNLPQPQTKTNDDTFSLMELDAILERMKAKYRPRPVVLSGKNRGTFEEMEHNLVNCYSKNKDQPLECSKLSREYTAFVNQQRDRILREVSRKESPILS